VNQRQRVLAILRGEQPDQVPWFADLDYYAGALEHRGLRPAGFRTSAEYIDWHRELRAGFYLQGYMPFREIRRRCTGQVRKAGNRTHRSIQTPAGELTETWLWSDESYSLAPVERLIKSAADLAAYRCLYEDVSYEPDYALAEERSRLVEDIGVVLCYTPRTPFMRMVAIDAGIENVVDLYMEAPEELEETLRVMEQALDQAVAMVLESPAEIVMIPENLSSEVVGPAFFEMFMREIQTKWVRWIHQAGKYSCMHMDGTLKGLLRQEASVGYSFIEALTPWPVGDLPVEEWKDYLGGQGCLGWGGIPGSYFSPGTSGEQFQEFVASVLEVMRSEPRYVLGVADQVPPDGLEERIRLVADLVDRHGRY